MSSNKSKITSKSQTVIPRDVRELLDLRPGDRLRYRMTENGVVIEKALTSKGDPFAVFNEWSGKEDDQAYTEL